MNRFFLLILAVALSATTAHAAAVKYDADETFDFSTCESWAWKRPELPDASIAEGRIRRALGEGFTAKGYTSTEPNEADFLVDYHAAVGRELRLDESLGLPGRRNLRVDSYAKGVLIVDVFDRETGRLVWRGSVSDALASDPEKADKKTEKAVEKLLKKFPAP